MTKAKKCQNCCQSTSDAADESMFKRCSSCMSVYCTFYITTNSLASSCIICSNCSLGCLAYNNRSFHPVQLDQPTPSPSHPAPRAYVWFVVILIISILSVCCCGLDISFLNYPPLICFCCFSQQQKKLRIMLLSKWSLYLDYPLIIFAAYFRHKNYGTSTAWHSLQSTNANTCEWCDST